MQAEHLRRRKAPAGVRTVHWVLLDQSSSMLQADKLARAKGYLLALMDSLYRARDRVGVIGFSGSGARWLQRPAKAQTFNADWIRPLAGGGGSPLAQALDLLPRTPNPSGDCVCLWLLSDCRFAQLPAGPQHVDRCVIVDFDADPLLLGRGPLLAQQWKAEHQTVP